MAAQIDIYNRALQKLGAKTVSSVNDQSVAGRALATAYPTVKRSILRAHPWNCSIQRFSLPANATAPAFGPANAFPLPTKWLRVLPPDPAQDFNDRDWTVEGGQILTNWGAPLQVRLVMDIDESAMDDTLIEAIASRLGYELAESLTQSNEKKAACLSDYKMAIAEARKCNAIEKVPQEAVADTWITARI